MKTIKNIFDKVINKLAKTDDFEFVVENEVNDEIRSAEAFTVLQAMYFA